MTSNEIRQRFLDFFRAREHRVVASSSLVPANDPTLLFSNAGMNQFKDVFLGREKRDYKRACSSQKCVRAGGKHNDLEQVGRTTRHHTFFEMLGNFSFGDYFKQEAIPWAWELITVDFGIPKDKLYVTIFEGAKEQDIPRDAEAYDRWREIVPADRIFELGMKDNFWQMGETGPCGPCSEIHYDLGPAASEQGHTDCRFPCDCGRYVELWNLVFMQYNRDEQGTLAPLPRPSIDTGAGLERLATVLQGKLSNFETDLFRPLIDEAAALANVEYGANHASDVSLRIIADHARAATFLISDGVLPSNEGRGYVLRLIMRRALYHGQTLGLNEPFLYKLSGNVVEMMKYAYPELIVTAHHVAKAIKIEEERYAHTTRLGLERLRQVKVFTSAGDFRTFGDLQDAFSKGGLPAEMKLIQTSHPDGPSFHIDAIEGEPLFEAGFLGRIEGVDLFQLHDTFGLRPEFVADIARTYGLTVDRKGYEAEMARQREQGRASWTGGKITGGWFEGKYAHIHDRYDRYPIFDPDRAPTVEDTRIVAIVVGENEVEHVQPGSRAEVFLYTSPFYAEAGGQVGDTGDLRDPTNQALLARVLDTQKVRHLYSSHVVDVIQPLEKGMPVRAVVDAQRRDAIRRNHTATHLLHAALRHTLGTHVKQAGSLVAPDRLRFDFSHYAPLDPQDLLDIEDLVNEHVLKNEEVVTNVMELDAAVNSGAMALFGEKYGDRVRVVSIDDGSFSKELCGGTHVRRTGDIGLFKVVSEGSVAAGTRRIEALTGTGVLEDLRHAYQTLKQLEQTLRSKPEELAEAAEKLAESEKKLRKQLEAQQMKRAAASAGDLVDRAQDVKGVRVLAARVESMDRAAMRQMVDSLRARLASGVIVLGSASDGKVSLIAAVTQDLTSRLDAGKIVKAAAAIVEGSGGGRKDLAEAGGKNPEKLDESLQAVPGIVEAML